MKSSIAIAAERRHALPLDAATATWALLGVKGSGKSYGMMRLFELLFDLSVQCIAVDPVGKMWGLRLGKDGRSSGLGTYIFGGKKADFPLNPISGAFMAKLLVETGISAILDVSQWRKGERRRFCTEFAEEFFHLKQGQDDPAPSHLFLEEAHTLVPQRLFRGSGEEKMLGAFEDIIRLGRNCGIGVTLASQRAADVNKSCLNMADVLVVLRILGELDRKTIHGWVVEKDAPKELMSELPFLKAGQAFLYAPTFNIYEKIDISARETFDSSATPKVGVKIKNASRKLTPIDAKHIEQAMSQVVEEAKANDPTALRQEVVALRTELADAERRAAHSTKCPVPKTRVKELPVLKERHLARVEKLVEKMVRTSRFTINTVNEVSEMLKGIKHAVASRPVAAQGEPQAGAGVISLPNRPAPPPFSQPRPVTPLGHPNGEEPQTLTRYALQLLQTVADRRPMQLTRRQIAVLSGRSTASSAFDRAMSRLLKEGTLAKVGDRYALTVVGVELVGPAPGSPASRAELVTMWKSALPRYECALFDALLRIHETAEGTSRAALGDAAGKSITSSAFDQAISSLRKNGLVTVDTGVIRLVPELCPDRSGWTGS